MSNQNKWKIAVDRGGTFTDVIGLDPDGVFHCLKLLSSSSDYEDASIEGIRRMIGIGPDDSLSAGIIQGLRFGTTVATNALLERKGCSTALLITKGFADLLEIGFQNRPEIFSLCIKKSPPLYSTVVEVDERVGSRGTVVKGLDEKGLSAQLELLKASGVDSVAVVLMHSWINPIHELRSGDILKEQGFSNIFLSHRTVNLIKMVSRGQSTLVDAYLSTVLAQYLETIKSEAGPVHLEFMQSSGSLTLPEEFNGKNAILSGPAGGVAAVARIADEMKVGGVVGFDMGGTSTDVSRFDGRFEKIYEQVIGDIPLQTEMLNIVTVAAGGGSVLNFDGQKMTAGPESAGASPGPACYGMGGPLTITDANLLTGRIVPWYFPKTFGPRNDSPLDTKIVEERFARLVAEINGSMGTSYGLHDAAAGFLRVANEKMAMAIKEISVSKGFDVREYALVCFGEVRGGSMPAP
jgi:5-oxoprolinase (ATP-hydrolysing)